jgi:hypothetical protein
MAGVEEEGHMLARHPDFELLDQRAHLGVIDICAEQHVELQGLELRGDIGGVVDRIDQARDVAVRGIADHQRDAFAARNFLRVGRCSRAGCCCGHDHERQSGAECRVSHEISLPINWAVKIK